MIIHKHTHEEIWLIIDNLQEERDILVKQVDRVRRYSPLAANNYIKIIFEKDSQIKILKEVFNLR